MEKESSDWECSLTEAWTDASSTEDFKIRGMDRSKKGSVTVRDIWHSRQVIVDANTPKNIDLITELSTILEIGTVSAEESEEQLEAEDATSSSSPN